MLLLIDGIIPIEFVLQFILESEWDWMRSSFFRMPNINCKSTRWGEF